MLLLLSLLMMTRSVLLLQIPKLIAEGDADGFLCWLGGWIFVIMMMGWEDSPRASTWLLIDGVYCNYVE